jgi:hypothetical protein
VLFFGAGTVQPLYLSIGAPTSPRVANALLFQFDLGMSSFCNENGMIYTRYADDITISSDGFLDKGMVLGFIEGLLKVQAHPRLRLNAQKTALYSRASSRRVTGITLANDGTLSLGRDRKRLIRAMVHRAAHGELNNEERDRVRGLIAFAADVEPDFIARLEKKYGKLSVQ